MRIKVTPADLESTSTYTDQASKILADLSSILAHEGGAAASAAGIAEAVDAIGSWLAHHADLFTSVVGLSGELGRALGSASQGYVATDDHAIPGITPTGGPSGG